MSSANIGFEETLWKAADKLRGSMDASEYKHVVLGFIFLKYISDKFETKYEELVEEGQGFEEDRDEYTYENIFWVPKEARWDFIKDNAKDTKIGQYIDDAMILIEKENNIDISNVYRVLGIYNKNKNEVMNSEILSKWLNITQRSCNRIIVQLVEHNLIKQTNVENDKKCVKSYNALYKENYEPRCICNYSLPPDKKIVLLMHGSPCQDFSRIGEKLGGKIGSGTRSSLLFETIRIIEEIQDRPGWVIWENVKGVLDRKMRASFFITLMKWKG